MILSRIMGVGCSGNPKCNTALEKETSICDPVQPMSHRAYTSGMVAAFDTLSAEKELQAAGFQQAQAQAVARIVRDGQGNLAIKGDIAALRTEVTAVRTELHAMKWVLVLVTALNVAILVRLLLD